MTIILTYRLDDEDHRLTAHAATQEVALATLRDRVPAGARVLSTAISFD